MSEDRRHSYRYQVGPDLGEATIRAGSNRYPVKLLEQSAGGFGVQSARVLNLRSGQEVLLILAEATYEVVVVYLVEENDVQRIGLRRICEVPANQSHRDRWDQKLRPPYFSMGVLSLCIAFFGGGVALPMLVNGITSEKPRQELSISTGHETRMTKSVLLLHQLKSKQFMDDLELDQVQQQRVQTVVDEAVFNLAALFENREKMSQDEWCSIGFQLLHRAWLEIQATLSDEQKARWDQLLAASATATQAS